MKRFAFQVAGRRIVGVVGFTSVIATLDHSELSFENVSIRFMLYFLIIKRQVCAMYNVCQNQIPL